MFGLQNDGITPGQDGLQVTTGRITEFSENNSAWYDFTKTNVLHDSKQQSIVLSLEPYVKELEDLGEKNVRNPGHFYTQLTGRDRPRPTGTLRLRDDDDDLQPFAAFHESLNSLNDLRAKHNLSSLSPEDVFKNARDFALKSREKYFYVSQNATAMGDLGGIAGMFGAGAESMFMSPAAPLMFVGAPWRMGGKFLMWNFTNKFAVGAAQIANHALIDGFANASLEAMGQRDVANWWGELGLKYDAETFWYHVGLAGLFGGGFGATIRGGIIGVPLAGRGTTAAIDKIRGPQYALGRQLLKDISQKDLRALEEAIINLSPDQIRKGIQALQKAGVEISPDGVAALRILEHEDENPVGGSRVNAEPEHMDRSVAADFALENDIPPNMPHLPDNGQKIPDSPFHFDNLDGEVFRFRPEQIEVDAKVFQFKSGGDRFGVIDTLRDVTEWNPDLGGTIHVYEYADGRLVVADGHQRLGLAKRLKLQNPDLDIRLYARKWREVDGITPAEARAKAATANIVNGTGTLIDAVKVLRMNPEQLAQLKQAGTFVRQARDLAKVTNDDAYFMVVNELVDAKYASLVGKFVSDPDKQLAIMRLLQKTEPRTMLEAEMIIRQANELDFTKTVQNNLFGDEQILTSLFKERARVLEEAIKLLRRDKTVFNSLVENQRRIEAEGNTLASDTNIERATHDGQAIQIIQTQASRKGPLSDALGEAAKQFQIDGNLSAAARGFVESVRQSARRGDYDGHNLGHEGRALDAETQIDPVTNLRDFEEPNGAGSAAQANNLKDAILMEAASGERIVADSRPYLEPTKDSVDVPLEQIIPIRRRPEGVSNARKFMLQSGRGEIPRRGPITLKDNKDGTFELLDGNSTYAIAQEAGMPSLPARILTQKEFDAEEAVKAANIMTELNPKKAKKRVVLAENLTPDHLSELTGTLKSRQAYKSIDDIIERNTKFNVQLNDAVKLAAGEHKIEFHPGPIKKRHRIEAKINDKYAGELNEIADVSRASVTVRSPGEATEFIKTLGKTFHVVDEGFQAPPRGNPSYSGYFDKKLMVISEDGVIGEVIIIEHNIFKAKHDQGGHQLYEIVRGNLNNAKFIADIPEIIAKIPDPDIRAKMQNLIDDPENLQVLANGEMIKLYEGAHPKMGDDFIQLSGNLLRSAPDSRDLRLNAASSISGERVSASSSLGEISPQVAVDRFQMNALPSSRRTVGVDPSSEKNLMPPNIVTRADDFKTETTAQGQQAIMPGVDPITPATRAQEAVDAPMTGGSAPMDIGLFDLGARGQADLLDLEIPTGTRLNDANEIVPEAQTVRQILNEVDQDEKMLKRLETCV